MSIHLRIYGDFFPAFCKTGRGGMPTVCPRITSARYTVRPLTRGGRYVIIPL